MKYFVLLAGYGEMPPWDTLTPEEQEEGMAKHGQFVEACAERSTVEILSSEALGGGFNGHHAANSRGDDDGRRRPLRGGGRTDRGLLPARGARSRYSHRTLWSPPDL